MLTVGLEELEEVNRNISERIHPAENHIVFETNHGVDRSVTELDIPSMLVLTELVTSTPHRAVQGPFTRCDYDYDCDFSYGNQWIVQDTMQVITLWDCNVTSPGSNLCGTENVS